MQLDGGTITPAPTRRFTSAPFHPFWFDVETPIPSWRQTAGTSAGQSTVGDALIESYTPATGVRDWSFQIVPISRSASESVAVESSSPSVAEVVGNVVRYVSTGSSTVTVSSPVRSVSYNLSFASRGGVMTSQLVNYVSGSAARGCCDEIDSRIAGKSAATALPVFTTQNHAAGIYVRNTSCWAADIDLTCVSPWNSAGANTRAGVLISPRHILFAAHYKIPNGATVRFVSGSNVAVNRTLTSQLTFPGYAPYHPDFVVGLLDSDVPAGIGFAKVLPENYATKFPNVSTYGQIPCICFDQEEKAPVQDWAGLYVANTGLDYCQFAQPVDAQRLAFFESKIVGDSGNPSFIVINGEAVLLTVLTYGGAGGGTELPPRISELNAMMTTLGGGYQLTEADLSGFPNY